VRGVDRQCKIVLSQLMAPLCPPTPLPSSVAVAALTTLLPLHEAVATGGEFGVFEGRTASLVHPAVMFVLFGTSLYSGYLGWQWKRLRTVGNELRFVRFMSYGG
jgi:hypothetical protein